MIGKILDLYALKKYSPEMHKAKIRKSEKLLSLAQQLDVSTHLPHSSTDQTYKKPNQDQSAEHT